MGREKHSALFSFEAGKCACASLKQTTKSCCKDERGIIKIENDQAGSKVINYPTPEVSLIGQIYTELILSLPDYVAESSFLESVLPPPKVPIYQSNCSLVFYESLV